MAEIDLPSTGAPSRRALNAAGYTHLQQLDGVPLRELMALHGMGPKAIGILRSALAEYGWAFADDDPSIGAAYGTSAAATGGRKPKRSANATAPTDVDATEWVASLPKKRQREDGAALLALFGEVTGEAPVMWGPSIVGYGSMHYAYDSGREGDAARVGFSPRSASNSLYGLLGHDGTDALLARLGKHRAGAGCLYVNKLADVDIDVLRELVALGWRSSAS